ncbi:hypothetical protein [Chloroflexus aggregans]|uniref:Abortive infection protein n=1 Tax=Chloroflexus aggregans (strain MD-66 / DSM 9485) TaxID=326427 RepID=B8GD52_CHLAD|nr:hypothetical protein [Chloroflexus aggregans]ACL25119.1 conserved hypothetical protein [Chloroflexus aggregans DSM 9485]
MEYELTKHRTLSHLDQYILLYWLISSVIGIPLLADWLRSWNVPVTLGNPLFVAFLLISFAFSQVLYVMVARHDGRPFLVGPTVIFSIGNGVIETFAFATVYRIGAWIGDGLAAHFWPGLVGALGFAVGFTAFVIYGGVIHGMFWLQQLPPHLDDTPRSMQIRKLRPLAEMALVLGWSLCLYLYQDIWTVIFIHILVDLGLMLRVRPPVFLGASRRYDQALD